MKFFLNQLKFCIYLYIIQIINLLHKILLEHTLFFYQVAN